MLLTGDCFSVENATEESIHLWFNSEHKFGEYITLTAVDGNSLDAGTVWLGKDPTDWEGEDWPKPADFELVYHEGHTGKRFVFSDLLDQEQVKAFFLSFLNEGKIETDNPKWRRFSVPPC